MRKSAVIFGALVTAMLCSATQGRDGPPAPPPPFDGGAPMNEYWDAIATLRMARRTLEARTTPAANPTPESTQEIEDAVAAIRTAERALEANAARLRDVMVAASIYPVPPVPGTAGLAESREPPLAIRGHE
jgi:hypothetical protein